MNKEQFALDGILFLRLRLPLKPINKVFSNIMAAWDSGVCVCHFSQAVVHFTEMCDVS